MRIARTTLVLLVANLLAFGLVWRATSAHRQTVSTQDLLFPAALAKLELTDAGQKLVLEKRASAWRITAPIEWSANLWSVQRLLDEIRFIDGDKGFATAETKAAGGDLATYGLASPRWTLRATSEAGVAVEVKIGENRNTRRLFLLTPDGSRIIALGDAMAAALEAKPESYRVDKVFEIPDFEVRTATARLRLKDNDMVTSLSLEERARAGRRNQGPEWRFEAPFDALADPDRATKAVTELSNLRAVKFAEAAEAETGLATPELRLGLEGNSRRQVLLVGKSQAGNAALRWAKLEDNASLFLVEAKALADWENPKAALASARPADFDPELVSGLTLTSGGRFITLHRLDATGAEPRWEIPVAPGSTATKRREADGKLIREFLTSLTRLRATLAGATATPSLVPAAQLPAEPTHKVELEFGGDRLTLSFYAAPAHLAAPGALLVHQKGTPLAALCDVSLLRNAQAAVDPKAWRNRGLAELAAGAKVTGLRLTERADGKVIGEARLGPDGNWAGNGRLDPANSRRLAGALTQVRATEFPTRDIGAGEFRYELRVTDQAAAGATGASESFRTYLCTAPLNRTAVLVRDEADGDDFLLEASLAEILIPLLGTDGR
jgi:hypothetical protein